MPDEDTALTAQNDTDAADSGQADSQATESQQSTDTGANEESGENNQPDGQQTDSDSDNSEDSTEGAPESYETFTVPEGMVLDQQAVDAFAPLAQEHDLSQVEAQKFVDIVAQMRQQEAQAVTDQWADTEQQWKDDRESDKEFGGDNYQENLGIAQRALDAYGSPELTALLDSSRMGNHPEVIRFFYRIGKEVAEDGTTRSNADGGGEKTLAQKLYPNQG